MVTGDGVGDDIGKLPLYCDRGTHRRVIHAEQVLFGLDKRHAVFLGVLHDRLDARVETPAHARACRCRAAAQRSSATAGSMADGHSCIRARTASCAAAACAHRSSSLRS